MARATLGNANMFGFRWDQVDVIRKGELPEGRKVLSIETEFDDLEIYISKTGRSIRVFREGEELL